MTFGYHARAERARPGVGAGWGVSSLHPGSSRESKNVTFYPKEGSLINPPAVRPARYAAW